MKRRSRILGLICLAIVILAAAALFAACEEPHERHAWSDWETVAATCTEPGYRFRYCYCGEEERREIAALGHSIPTSYQSDGIYHWKQCLRCKAEFDKEYCTPEKISRHLDEPIEGHSPFGYSVVNPRPSTDTLEEYQCTKCKTKSAYDQKLVFTLNEDGESYNVRSASIDFYYPEEHVVIPAVYVGKPVTSVGKFSRILKSIELPDSIEYLAARAFEGCDFLEEIKFGSNVSKMEPFGEATFFGCELLRSVIILPDAQKEIPQFLFRGCASLTEIEIPEGVTSIGDNVFNGCASLKEIKIPEGVTSIGSSAFSGCESLTEVKIPSGVTNIANSLFHGCVSLAEIEIPESVTSIGSNAFSSCESLAEVKIPSGVTNIANSLFYGCASLSEIEIPGGVTEIGDWAFRGCSALGSVALPEKLQKMGGYAFNNCTSLAEVIIPATLDDSLVMAGAYIFTGTPFFEAQPDGPFYLGRIYVQYKGDASDRTVEIRPGTVVIAEHAFQSGSYARVTIPESVKRIGDYAFNNSELKSLIVPGTVEEIAKNSFGGRYSPTVYTDAEQRPEGWLCDNMNVVYGCEIEDGYVVSFTKREGSVNHYTLIAFEDPLREGYDFMGWATAPDGDAEYASPELAEFPDGKYYAVWRKSE